MPKRKSISGAVKRDVWLKYVGDKTKTKCFCCKKNEIMAFACLHNTWQAGHIISHKNGGKAEIINLHPICKQCNNNMNDENWDDYIDRHTNLHHSLPWIEGNYKDCEKEIILLQRLFRMRQKFKLSPWPHPPPHPRPRLRRPRPQSKCFRYVPGNVFISKK